MTTGSPNASAKMRTLCAVSGEVGRPQCPHIVAKAEFVAVQSGHLILAEAGAIAGVSSPR